MRKNKMNSKYETYVASDTIKVDDETAKFISESIDYATLSKEQTEKLRQSKVDQELFALGTVSAISNKDLDTVLFENSDSYFQGFNYGKNLIKNITNEAKKRFPTPLDNPVAIAFAHALIKKDVKIDTIK